MVPELAPTGERRDAPLDQPRVPFASGAFKPRTLLSLLVAALLLIVVFQKLGDFRAAIATARQVNLALYPLAFLVYAVTFPVRGWRWQRLLRNAGEARAAGPLTHFIFQSWFANCLLPAKAGDIYRAYLAKTKAGIPLSTSAGTVMAERIIDTLVVFLTFIAVGLHLFRDRLPPEVRLLMNVGLGLIAVVVLLLLTMRPLSRAVFARLPSARLERLYRGFEQATLASPRSLWPVLGLTALLWALEVARLFTVARSLGSASPSLSHFGLLTAIFATVASSVLTLVPTPGGLGAVEGGLTGMLMILGLHPGVALALVLMDRLVSYWAIVIGGALDYLVLCWRDHGKAPA